MQISAERKAIEAAFDRYEAQLDKIPGERFTQTPEGGGWSFAEVYSHILQATFGSTIALQRCSNGPNMRPDRGLTLAGRVILFTGSFPLLKVKVPQALARKMPVQKISKEEARNLLTRCRKRIDDVIPLLETAAGNCRQEHPRLGMLNAKQWFKFIRIHLEHHLKQLVRIEKKLKHQ